MITQELIILISAHVFLLLTSAIIFYALLLQLLAKRGTNKKSLLLYSILGFSTAAAAWLISITYLSDYYIGKEGLVTSLDTTTLVPTLVLVRELLLPLLVVGALIVFFAVWFKGERINDHLKLKGGLVILSVVTSVAAMALTFLGILIP